MSFIIKIFSHQLRGAPWPVAEYIVFLYSISQALGVENSMKEREGKAQERRGRKYETEKLGRQRFLLWVYM